MRIRSARRLPTRWSALAVLAVVVSVSGVNPVASAATPGITVPGAPPEVRGQGNAWPLPDHDYNNSRDAGASPIRASTVSRLTTAWSVPMSVGASTSPIVIGGMTYVQDEAGTVYAIDASSGLVKWKTKPLGFSIGPWGVSVGWGKLFASTSTGVAAFRLSDGTPLWTRKITTTAGQGVDMQTLPYGGRVYIASVPVNVGNYYKGGSVGYLEALDAATGKVDWTFDTVRSKNLWGNPAVNSGGGAWYPPAIDIRRNTLYWGVANPAPFVGTPTYPNGSSRPGNNLYTDSMVALSASTGKLLWYHQVFPHDLYDRDEVQAMLVPVRQAVDGSSEVAISSGKGGFVLGLNPSTGRLLWKTAVGIHRNGDLPKLTGPDDGLSRHLRRRADTAGFGGRRRLCGDVERVVDPHARSHVLFRRKDRDHGWRRRGDVGPDGEGCVGHQGPGRSHGRCHRCQRPGPDGDLPGRSGGPEPEHRRHRLEGAGARSDQRVDVRGRGRVYVPVGSSARLVALKLPANN